mmetsp:Transcript_88973/g.251724  ORF Transcript_88973/g.251724 Transcript_88973/m.251724 type:complete len:405 (+) Transcript_88973:514-1728(+)
MSSPPTCSSAAATPPQRRADTWTMRPRRRGRRRSSSTCRTRGCCPRRALPRTPASISCSARRATWRQRSSPRRAPTACSATSTRSAAPCTPWFPAASCPGGTRASACSPACQRTPLRRCRASWRACSTASRGTGLPWLRPWRTRGCAEGRRPAARSRGAASDGPCPRPALELRQYGAPVEPARRSPSTARAECRPRAPARSEAPLRGSLSLSLSLRGLPRHAATGPGGSVAPAPPASAARARRRGCSEATRRARSGCGPCAACSSSARGPRTSPTPAASGAACQTRTPMLSCRTYSPGTAISSTRGSWRLKRPSARGSTRSSAAARTSRRTGGPGVATPPTRAPLRPCPPRRDSMCTLPTCPLTRGGPSSGRAPRAARCSTRPTAWTRTGLRLPWRSWCPRRCS